MRARLLALSFFVLLFANACRDELAGPGHSGSSSNQARGQQGGNGQIPTGRVLDQVPPLQFQNGTTLGDGTIQYLGARYAVQPNGQVAVAQYFTALKTPPQGYSMFVHVVDAATGQMVTNADHEFQGGKLPLERWPVGKVVEDIHAFALPQGAPKTIQLLLGFWKGDARLPVDQAAYQDGQNRLLGPQIQTSAPTLPELPVYHAKRASHPPRMDGTLNDDAWRAAEPVTLVGSLDGRPAPTKTVARVLYDNAYIYVGFDVESTDVWGTLTSRDSEIYTQEVVEAFFDANADMKTYNELEVSPNNVIFDSYFPEYRKGETSWDSGMETAVKVRGTVNNPADKDQGWTAEMKIPIAKLAEVPHVPPQKGDRWRFNLYYLNNRTNNGQAFSPLFRGDFHNLPRFGWLEFE
jgi:hypothetical protein